MKISTRLKQLREDLKITQQAVGALGWVSTPGFIKVENGQRSPSGKLLEKFVAFYAAEKKLSKAKTADLKDQLLTLKYLGDSSAFVKSLATAHAKSRPDGETLLAVETKVAPKRGRPVTKMKAQTVK